MAEERDSGKRVQDMPPLYQEMGLLEQFNLPPGVIRVLRRNQRAIWTVLAALLLFALALSAYSAYSGHRQEKAAAALDAALRAQSGQRELLQQVQNDFAATPSALWADVALARLDEREGKADDAIQRYQGIRTRLDKKSPLLAPVLAKLAAMEEQKKNWEAAISYYQELEQLQGYAADAHLHMGRVYEAQGKKEEALARYKRFLDDTATAGEQADADPRRQMISSHIELLQAR